MEFQAEKPKQKRQKFETLGSLEVAKTGVFEHVLGHDLEKDCSSFPIVTGNLDELGHLFLRYVKLLRLLLEDVFSLKMFTFFLVPKLVSQVFWNPMSFWKVCSSTSIRHQLHTFSEFWLWRIRSCQCCCGLNRFNSKEFLKLKTS